LNKIRIIEIKIFFLKNSDFVEELMMILVSF